MFAVVEKCGRPDEELGRGVYIFVWHLADGSTVSVGTPYLERIGDIRWTDASGQTSSLLGTRNRSVSTGKQVQTGNLGLYRFSDKPGVASLVGLAPIIRSIREGLKIGILAVLARQEWRLMPWTWRVLGPPESI
jgi:hypothetical protein